MTRFAPGTPKEVMEEFNKKFYGNQGKLGSNQGGISGMATAGSGGLTGIRDAASDLIGQAEGISQMSQSLVGGGGGMASISRGTGTGPFGSNAIDALSGLGVKAYKKGGKVKVSSASKRADGIAQRGKTRGKMV